MEYGVEHLGKNMAETMHSKNIEDNVAQKIHDSVVYGGVAAIR